jgi:dynein heavy chain
MEKMVEWRTLAWKDVIINIQKMTDIMDSFQGRCRKMPKKLRDWDAYVELKQKIEDFQTVLPLLTELSKESIKPRHWSEVMKVTGKTFTVDSEELKLQTLLDADLVTPHEEVEEICEGADKELGIESKLAEIKERWALEDFDFMPWKGRSVQVLKGVVPIVEELEEAQMQLQTMLTMRHVAPFKAEVQAKLSQLSDTSDTLERWLKVQMLWCSLESVFTGGDIAKQMPLEAKKFAKVDKDWVKIMAKAEETCQVVNCCSNELLRNTLPVMYSELEKCQKSLEGYLEQKRNKFPRFYFVSNPVLLQILSQGSDPAAVQQYYEKIFDSISFVEHDKADPSLINAIVSRKGRDEERIPLESQVKAQGNIEEWLMDLLREHQRSMKAVCGEAAADIGSVSSDIETLRSFVDKFPGQFALLGIQLLWTSDMQYALENCKAKKTIMKDTLKKCADVLRIISSWCLQDLGSKMNRTKIETMVTIQVHQRDCTADINSLFKNRKITSSDDFEWLKQARFRWDPDEEDEHGDGACIISVADVDFKYSYEYLGCKDRLVITPLTDRCYITLSQALGMYFGGAPAGPAGTGKTETVKDMGRALGIYVVVTNCTDQMRYTDCAKIFKGLCQGGLWGCFDEFNRITLPVLSVVAQQVLAIQNAKKGNVEFFQFPGDPQNVLLNPVCGFFITMNPGYAGRQELPENLKALFRGVAMMVPDREIIMKVKLCAVGYTDFTGLSKKFFTLYSLCEEQLSKQNHYDFGLRNILSVLRTAGQTKRDNLDKDEQMLLYRTLRDMNLSKLIAQDVPLFLSLLEDLFPSIPTPAKAVYADMLAAIEKSVKEAGLVMHDAWVTKVIQLYETTLVRHGIMLSGPTGGGKSRIFEILQSSLAKVSGTTYKMAKLNPKAIRAAEMYGEADPMSGEWTTGVFASMWAKYNQRSNKFNTWIVADGPVDAIWIEDLNTVLDDNRILTLANGDRIPMTDNTKIMFEVECLDNASPATVSRAGIVYVSDTDLDWLPIVDAWLLTQPDVYRTVMRDLFLKYVGTPTPVDPGHIYNFLTRQCTEVIMQSRAGKIASMFNLLQALIEKAELAAGGEELYNELEKLVLYAVSWGIGGLLEPADRSKWDAYMRTVAPSAAMPACDEGETIFEYYVDYSSLAWEKWRPPEWLYPDTEELDFSNLLVPTMDSTRALFLLDCLHSYRKPIMMVGGPGTAKTSCALLFCSNFDPDARTLKRVNFSSATTSGMFQATIEAELDKRGGKNYGPPSGKKMTVFLDDVSMPHINEWGDQPTNEIVRQLVESHGFMFLDKDKRGDFKVCEDLDYVGAMGHPGGGKNDIPMRLKRQFFIFNLILPSITSINDIYGQMLSGRFPGEEFDDTALEVVNKLTTATIELWHRVRDKMLPTPAKFHYVFNMRELSRVFQGVLLTPKDIIKTGGQQCPSDSAAGTLLTLWKHECERVFCDKLTNNTDKDWYVQAMEKLLVERFGVELAKKTQEDAYFVDFFREDVYDEDDILVNLAPKIYEQGGSLETVRERVTKFMNQHNEENSARPLPLVLFDDALRHMLRISRVIEMPRGNALLVGVGGSGKQSLTRLAAFIARHECRQITLTKSYNVSSLMDDLRELYDLAGHQRKDVTFIFTDSEIKDENFLEYLNSILLTGEVAGLFPKDEMLAMCADLQSFFEAERPGLDPTPDNLKQYFVDLSRDHLHVVLCMSPVNVKFPERARKFPGLISGCTIDWFLPWPEEALSAVAQGFLGDFHIECDASEKEQLILHMGAVHTLVTETCDDYFTQMRRHVYQTPKSYLSFLEVYRQTYQQKLDEIKHKEESVNLGLTKLVQGAEDVEKMKLVLADKAKELEKATEETNKMLSSLEVSSHEAKKESDKVAKIKTGCEAEAERIAVEKSACEADLAKAQPYVDEAERAIQSIKPGDISEMKALKKPSDIIRLVFDGVLILFCGSLNPVKAAGLVVAKQEIAFIEPSYNFASSLMADPKFLAKVMEFGRVGKDNINEETIEFMLPYIEMEQFTPKNAKSASKAAEGLCVWVTAMKFYHEASKIIKPKLEALGVAEAQMEIAERELAQAEAREEECRAMLSKLQQDFEAQMGAKQEIEAGAATLKKKMDMASALINGLAGERERWTEDSKSFADIKRRLVGDCAVACAFVSYCGPFNAPFRELLVSERFTTDLQNRQVPVTEGLEVTDFLVDIGTVGDWNLQGLPTDQLSVQNGILVTRSSRYPLLCDPQGQALNWIKNKESENMPIWGPTAINSNKLKDQLEFCMAEGKALVIVGVEQDIDPMLDPVMEKRIIKKAKSKYINVADKMCEFDDNFRLYFITRLPNPHFSPELQAKTTLVDFTVTMKGLEDQLLGRVIGKEQRALEEQLTQVLEEVNANTKALLQLDALLLERLTSNEGNLLDDTELVGVLANTKAKAGEVKEKLQSADDTRRSINEKREQFRPVATRGSVLYFSIVEMQGVNDMYQTSLAQFLELFMRSMDVAEKASLASKRVNNIIDSMTYLVYRYINRGLYEPDKLLFVFIVTLKILVSAGMISPSEVSLFLRGGAALDINSERKKPFAWLSNESWLNALALSKSYPSFFKALPDSIAKNEALWRRWYEDNEPEAQNIPDFETPIAEDTSIGPFLRLLLVRMLRMDRALLVIKEFVRHTEAMGPRYVEPVTDTIESIFDGMVAEVPVIFLLSVGGDPTDSIEVLAKKKKQSVQCVSMGQGQEPVAIKAINAAAVNGSWVLLQNCELGLGLMVQMEDLIIKIREGINPDFRLFITAMPSSEFPLGLLQMGTKVTNEPPAGLQAGCLRSFTVMVDQDRLERIETPAWRQLIFGLCFLHSSVVERRKFGPLGWNIPYEYNDGDLNASLMFIEKHLYSGAISWPTVQYMVSEVQYGGKITDDMDRRLFATYAETWMSPRILEPDFTYNPATPIAPIPGAFVYTVFASTEIERYRAVASSFPEIDSPEIFGLHPNADLTFRVKEVTAFVNVMSDTQPKESGGGGGATREDVVMEKASELLKQLPEDYIEDDYMSKIRGKLGGMKIPLNIFLFQEIQRLQRVIARVRNMLTAMQQAIRGEVVMTTELLESINDIYDARVPKSWLYNPGGSEFSWLLPTLGLWFTSLLERDAQNRGWLNSGRPNAFWLTGFFNPQGFLTGMKQEVTRKHKGWAIDNVVYLTEVTKFDRIEQVRQGPAEGVFIHGLFLDGAGWDKASDTIVESEPKKMFASLPVLHVTGVTKADKAQKRDPSGFYECPCYKYPARTDRYRIFMVDLPTTTLKPRHWILRGAALLCSTD